jgi:hypothetical protein
LAEVFGGYARNEPRDFWARRTATEKDTYEQSAVTRIDQPGEPHGAGGTPRCSIFGAAVLGEKRPVEVPGF